MRKINESLDGGFILSGESYSPISGNKSESNLGVEQTWVVKTDSTGIPVWDKTIFSNGHDEEGT
ncbi:MAG: T9SS C-terminal target domain-containing protein, partial [Bacteroidota bacterium]